MIPTCILVADAARARLFEVGRKGRWKLRSSAENPEGRAHSRDYQHDASGGLQLSEGAQARGAMAPLSIKKVEADRFARALSTQLEREVAQSRIERIVLVAPPAFLGMLRAHLHPDIERRIYQTVAKELAGADERELAERIHVIH